METKTVGIVAAVVLAVVALPLVLGLLASDKIKMENYNKVNMGMTYAQVSEILGEGESKTLEQLIQEGSAAMPPMPQLPPGVQMNAIQDMLKLTIYVWEKDENTGIMAGFSSNSLVMKGQEGLADQPSFDAGGLENMIPGFAL